MKKGLLIGTLISLGSCAVMLILSIFGISFFEGVKGDILISFATLTAGGIFAISSVNLIKYNKKIAYISLSAICLAVLLIIISTFAEIGGVFSDITFTVATLSILFNALAASITLSIFPKCLALLIAGINGNTANTTSAANHRPLLQDGSFMKSYVPATINTASNT